MTISSVKESAKLNDLGCENLMFSRMQTARLAISKSLDFACANRSICDV